MDGSSFQWLSSVILNSFIVYLVVKTLENFLGQNIFFHKSENVTSLALGSYKTIICGQKPIIFENDAIILKWCHHILKRCHHFINDTIIFENDAIILKMMENQASFLFYDCFYIKGKPSFSNMMGCWPETMVL